MKIDYIMSNQNEDLQGKIEYNVVYVEMPEIELDEDNKVILCKNTPLSLGNNVFTVPQAITEETTEGYSEGNSEIMPFNATSETENLDFSSSYLFYSSDFTDPPKINIKSLETLIDDKKTKCPNNNERLNKPITDRLKSRDRRKQTFPKYESDKAILTTHSANKTVRTSAPSSCEVNPGKDLMWLLNFKLDNFLQENPLDVQPSQTNDLKLSTTYSRIEKKGCQRNEAEEEELLKKPPFTYTELIECALIEKGPLTVSEIYQWISDIFPYYKAWDDRWKNSVRHNLSINPYFRKGGKAKQGAGHLWTVSDCAETARSITAKRQRFQEFEAYTKRMKLQKNKSTNDTGVERDLEADAREAEIAASIIYNIIEDKENQREEEMNCAEEMLSGVKREVAVEYIEPIGSAAGNDFLNPVSKEDLMGECGFFNQIELSMTAEPSENYETVEIDNYEQLDDLGFQFNDLNCHNMNVLPLVN